VSPPRRTRSHAGPPAGPGAAGDRERQETYVAVVHQLVTELGTARLLRLIADAATERANAIARQGASLQNARVSREAALLRRAADAILD